MNTIEWVFVVAAIFSFAFGLIVKVRTDSFLDLLIVSALIFGAFMSSRGCTEQAHLPLKDCEEQR
jgi:hypothetical protein